jgi:predicted nucleic acid-binding Zn ribbon protein
MSTERIPTIDPAWEYWTPEDPEIAEIIAKSAKGSSGFDLLGVEEWRSNKAGALIGLRFGKGNPDKFNGRLAPSRPITQRAESRCQFVRCPVCSRGFKQYRADRVYCSNRCSLTETAQRRRVRPSATKCSCGEGFEPLYTDQRFCSRQCAGRTGGGVVRLDHEHLLTLWDSGIGTTEIARQVGTTVCHVRRVAKAAGRTMRTPGRQPQKR